MACSKDDGSRLNEVFILRHCANEGGTVVTILKAVEAIRKNLPDHARRNLAINLLCVEYFHAMYLHRGFTNCIRVPFNVIPRFDIKITISISTAQYILEIIPNESLVVVYLLTQT